MIAFGSEIKKLIIGEESMERSQGIESSLGRILHSSSGEDGSQIDCDEESSPSAFQR